MCESFDLMKLMTKYRKNFERNGWFCKKLLHCWSKTRFVDEKVHGVHATWLFGILDRAFRVDGSKVDGSRVDGSKVEEQHSIA